MTQVRDTASDLLRPASVEQRRIEHVKRQLAGESVDASRFAYAFECWHVGAVASGAEAPSATKALADMLGCRHLLVRHDDGLVWAWFGHRARPDLWRLDRLAETRWPAGVCLAIGEAAHGIGGWRRTHRQARAAFLIAQRTPGRPIRYADVALLASMVQDDLLAVSLHDLYLAPLEDGRGGGVTLRQTLRAYFAAGRNGASAAAALNVSRQTITNRLQVVEARVGRPLVECAPAMEAALRLDELAGDAPHTVESLAKRPRR